MKHGEMVRVKDVMKTQFDVIHGIETVADALRQAQHLETECLLVDRRHDDDEYGIVLLADIAKKVLGADKAADRVNVYEIMSKPVISVAPVTPVSHYNCHGLCAGFCLVGQTAINFCQEPCYAF